MNSIFVIIFGTMAGAALGLLYVICAKVSQIVVLLRRIADRE
jgi:hypothetical protein